MPARVIESLATTDSLSDLFSDQSVLQAMLDFESALERALEKLSEVHRNTVMLGRTLMQPAPPVTFGLKAAGWLGAIRRSRKRLDDAFSEALIVQFGGASGTLASLGDKAIAVARELA